MIVLHWFRRDLRLHDNAALYHALKSGHQVQCIFIFDRNILEKLDDVQDRRVCFIYQTLEALNQELIGLGSSLVVYHDTPENAWKQALNEFNPSAVYANHDYEPYALERDQLVCNLLNTQGVDFHTFKDQCIFEKSEVVKADGKPYTVFTPYSRTWKAKLSTFYLKPYPCDRYFANLNKTIPQQLPTLNSLGFNNPGYQFPPPETTAGIIRHYAENRDYPALQATSMLGLHFRFGTISIRQKAAKAQQLSEVWLNELIWREFYMQILWHFPHVVQGSFRKEYDGIVWRNDETEFKAWCEGRTGYPMVDAGMRQLNATGYMHNRVRMVVASFLTKHLLIHWQWGEAYFAKKLLDFDLCANNGGWQWAAGCGTDAAPYFRIFNPSAQMQKFDPNLAYVKQWVPEYGTPQYVAPIVNHEMARVRCLETYKKALKP